MANEKGRNKQKREAKKIGRLRLLINTALCACSGGHLLKCNGVCQKLHMNPKTGRVECPELYHIDHSLIRTEGPRKSKRTWKYGRQKDTDEGENEKRYRREKWERNRSSSR